MAVGSIRAGGANRRHRVPGANRADRIYAHAFGKQHAFAIRKQRSVFTEGDDDMRNPARDERFCGEGQRWQRRIR